MDIEERERSYRISFEGEKMNRIDLKKIGCLLSILIFGFWGTRCATPKEELKKEKERLERDPSYVEKIAREKLGMVRKDEIILK